MIKNTIFRRYDIRGSIPTDFSVDDGSTIAHAVLTYYRRQAPDLKAIVLGHDARTTSPALRAQVHAAAHALGITVHDIGLCSSPEFYFTLYTGPVSSGIMITASHNPGQYNGFKLRLGRKPVWGNELLVIRDLCKTKNDFSHNWIPDRVREDVVPGLTRYPYAAYMKKNFIHLRDVHAVIDASNGAAGPAIEKIIKTLQLPNITLINTTPDGTFPNHPPDPSKKENLHELINLVTTASHPTIGLALDGDGDRLTLILEDGAHLPGDDLLALLAQPILKSHPDAHVVYDIKSSSRLINSIGKNGHFAPCGHTYIQEAMHTHNALLGGEVSGHLFFKDRYFGFDDGVYALLRVLELRQNAGRPLQELFAQLPTAYASAEQRIFCPEDQKEATLATIKEKVSTWPDARLVTTDGIRVELPSGWLLVRAAQTEPALSVRCEGVSAAARDELQKNLDLLLPKSSESVILGPL